MAPVKVLIIAHWRWHGPARFPRALKKVGFEVAAICAKSDLISMTDFVDRFFYTDTNEEAAVLQTFDNALRTFRPDIILAASDNLVRTLQVYRRQVEAGKIQLDDELKTALMNSTFPIEAEKYLFGKIDLLNELESRGVRIPPQRELHTMGDADAFIQEHGYPVILKPDVGFASSGVKICRDEESLLEGLQDLVFGRTRSRYCIQKYLGNQTAVIHYVAKDGELIAWNMAYRIRTHPGETGQTSATRVIDNPEILHAAREICRITNYNGMGAPQFVVEDEGKGRAWLMELNPRMGTYVHLWQDIGTDLALALREGWSGNMIPQQPVQEGLTIALYPQETLRDPDSEFIQGKHDVPTDDIKLMGIYQDIIKSAQERRAAQSTG